jgi:hypothetical protein
MIRNVRSIQKKFDLEHFLLSTLGHELFSPSVTPKSYESVQYLTKKGPIVQVLNHTKHIT